MDITKLTRAMEKAVELGVFPKAAGQDEYLRHWETLRQILESAAATEAEANPEAGSGRSAARIDPILQIISEIWHSEPDLRLCQILSNAGHYSGRNQHNRDGLYYFEDDDLYKALKKYKAEIEAFRQRKAERVSNET